MLPSKQQPKGLYILFMTEMWERFSFYAMRALLVLYMTTIERAGGLNWSNADALKLYSYYLGFAYITPVLGGWIADRHLGQRRSILLGGGLMALGHILMAIKNLPAFYSALIFIALGNGFFKPNVTSILGGLYEKHDPRRDSGYAIFYMGINVGGALAGASSAYLHQNYGFHHAFSAAALGMLIGLGIFWWGQTNFGNVGNKSIESHTQPFSIGKVEKQRMGVIAILSISIICFITAFEQAGGLLNLYANRWTDRHWGEWTVPTALFQSLNPIFVVLLSPIFSRLWTQLGNKNPSSSQKVAIGMLLCAAGFGMLWQLTPINVMQTEVGCHSMWLIIFYAIATAGELCILPVVWSAVSKLAPRQYASSLMAMSLFAVGVGGYLAGQLGALVDQLGPREIFAWIASSCTLMAMFIFMLSPCLKRWSHGLE